MKKISSLFFGIIFSVGLLIPATSMAAVAIPPENPGIISPNTTNNDSPSPAGTLQNPLENAGSVPGLINNLIKGLLTFTGALALLMFTWGGMQMILARGETSKYEAGKQTLVWAVIGLVVIFSSYGIVSTVISILEQS